VDPCASPADARAQGAVQARHPAAEARLRRAAAGSTARPCRRRWGRDADAGGSGPSSAAAAAGGGAGQGRCAASAGSRRQRDGVRQPSGGDRRLRALPPRAGAAHAGPRPPLLRPMIQ
jgi:hypothetical protein